MIDCARNRVRLAMGKVGVVSCGLGGRGGVVGWRINHLAPGTPVGGGDVPARCDWGNPHQHTTHPATIASLTTLQHLLGCDHGDAQMKTWPEVVETIAQCAAVVLTVMFVEQCAAVAK